MTPPLIPDRLPVLRSLDLEADALSVTRIPGTEELFVGADNGSVYHVDLAAETPQPQPLIGGHLSYVSGLANWHDGVISAGSDRRLVWWHRRTHERIHTREQAHAKWIRAIAMHPRLPILASVGDDMVCRLWDAETADLLSELRGHLEITAQHFRNKLFAVTFSRDGNFLATADQTGRVVIWDFEARTQVAVVEATKLYEWDETAEILNGHSFGGARCLDFSPDGHRLAVGGILNVDAAIIKGQALLMVFDWRSGALSTEYLDDGNCLYENVRFHHAGDWIVAAPGAGSATHFNFWNTQDPKLIKKAEGLVVYDMVLNETSDAIYVVGPKKIAKLSVHAPST